MATRKRKEPLSKELREKQLQAEIDRVVAAYNQDEVMERDLEVTLEENSDPAKEIDLMELEEAIEAEEEETEEAFNALEYRNMVEQCFLAIISNGQFSEASGVLERAQGLALEFVSWAHEYDQSGTS